MDQNQWSLSIGTGGRDASVRADKVRETVAEILNYMLDASANGLAGHRFVGGYFKDVSVRERFRNALVAAALQE